MSTDLSRLFDRLWPTLDHIPPGVDMFGHYPISGTPPPADLAQLGITESEWRRMLKSPDWPASLDALLSKEARP